MFPITYHGINLYNSQCFSKIEIGVNFNKIILAMELKNTICCSVHDHEKNQQFGQKKINELQDRT